MRVVPGQRNGDDFGSGPLRKAADPVACRGRDDELFPAANEGVDGHAHDFSRPAPQDDLICRDPVESGDPDLQRFRFQFRITIGRVKPRLLHHRFHFRRRAVGIFISGQANRPARFVDRLFQPEAACGAMRSLSKRKHGGRCRAGGNVSKNVPARDEHKVTEQ